MRQVETQEDNNPTYSFLIDSQSASANGGERYEIEDRTQMEPHQGTGAMASLSGISMDVMTNCHIRLHAALFQGHGI